MKTPTLIREQLYFGLDAQRLRDVASRVLARVEGLPADRATVGFEALTQDLGLPYAAGRATIEQMVGAGLLERLSPGGIVYNVTGKMRGYAQARIVEPLRRRDAQAILAHIASMAAHFNRTAVRNKYEIETIAVHGSYMSQAEALPDLLLAVTGRRRNAGGVTAGGRGTIQIEGTDAIRSLLAGDSHHIRVGFFQKVSEIPRPFSVVFKDEG